MFWANIVQTTLRSGLIQRLEFCPGVRTYAIMLWPVVQLQGRLWSHAGVFGAIFSCM